MRRRRSLIPILLALACLALLTTVIFRGSDFLLYPPSPTRTPVIQVTGTVSPRQHAPQLHVRGNQLFDSNNRVVRLIRVNRSGTAYRCLRYSIFDGPGDQASINAMLRWRIN